MGKKKGQPLTLPTWDTPRPDFEKPPVTEVVLSLQFNDLPDLGVLQMGRLWDCFRNKYPITDTKNALAAVHEAFERRPQPGIQFRIVSEPSAPRCWFENAARTELIQIQADRFIFNWKQTEAKEPYPRYEDVRAKFKRNFKIFTTFLKDNGMGAVTPNQCEVTYVNMLPAGTGWTRHGQLKDVFSPWSGRCSDGFLGEPEEGLFQIRYFLRAADKTPVGRLHISAEPQVRIEDDAPMIRFVLTARGAPLKKTQKAIIEFFDFGRENIVRGFTSFTSSQMHKAWGKK